jgi:hypothetical protein
MMQTDDGVRDANFNKLPRQLFHYANIAALGSDESIYYPNTGIIDSLPAGFGCPDWPPLQQSLSSNEQNVELAAFAARNASGLPTNVSCWVDARVAANLLTMAMVQRGRPCNDANPGQVCVNATIFWQPPNSACTETDPVLRAAQCANITYSVQMPQSTPCDNSALDGNGTAGVSAFQNAEGTCLTTASKFEAGLLLAANFTPVGNPYANNTLASPGAPVYPVAFGPESINAAWYALSLDAYIVLREGWNLLDVPQSRVSYGGNVWRPYAQHWCLPGELSCSDLWEVHARPRQEFEQEHEDDMPPAASSDNTSPPMLCYVASYYHADIFIRVVSTDGINSFVASRTVSGEQNVCASYRSRSRINGNWTWHYRVMTSSACSALAGAAAAAGSDAGSNVTHVTCCTTPYCNRPGELGGHAYVDASHL